MKETRKMAQVVKQTRERVHRCEINNFAKQTHDMGTLQIVGREEKTHSEGKILN